MTGPNPVQPPGGNHDPPQGRPHPLRQTDRGGPGLAHATQLLNEGEFYDKGRLFNIVRLGPGDAVGRHQHVGDMEVYHILKGQCRYDDNGTEVMLHAGDTAVCPDGEWHAVYNDGHDDMEMVCLILFK